MSPLSIVSRNDSPGPWRGPFDGSDWLADPVGTSRRTVTVHREERTTGRRREEIKGGPLRIAPIQSRIEEENARKSRNRAGGPPASSSPACYKYSPSFSKSFAKFSTHLRSFSIFAPLLCVYSPKKWIRSSVAKFQSHCATFVSSQRFQRALLSFRKQCGVLREREMQSL